MRCMFLDQTVQKRAAISAIQIFKADGIIDEIRINCCFPGVLINIGSYRHVFQTKTGVSLGNVRYSRGRG